ncbi:hypothetical protein B0H13DRAFT_1865065 [Mycena leptocephala]|nr:hypothetical protein B0H13DRAFT_1865065 [Mycena leptocephala]
MVLTSAWHLVFLSPELLSLAGDYQTGYNAGCARAWLYLLHFQVLDFLLEGDYPWNTPGPLSDTSVVLSLTSVKLRKKLQNWPQFLKAFHGLLGEWTSPSVLIPTQNTAIDLCNSAESLGPMLHFSELQDDTMASKRSRTFRQCLRLGTEFAPVFKNGEPAILPFAYVQSRYESNTGALDKLKHLRKVEKLLKPLSYALSISPTLAFLDADLSATHVDLYDAAYGALDLATTNL